MYPDQLGSIGKSYPYGVERPSATTNDREKFTGYFRDAETGNDYAVNRYESPGTGRFLTSDPYITSDGSNGDPADPGSWNKYAYTEGDPVNEVDPDGLCQEPPQLSGSGSGVSIGIGIGIGVGFPGGDPEVQTEVRRPCLGLNGIKRGPGPIPGLPFVAQIDVGSYSTTSGAAKQVQQDLLKLLGAIANNQNCNSWLASAGINIYPRLENPNGTLITSGIGVGTITGIGAAAVYGRNGTALPKGAVITVNLGGAFFTHVGMPPGTPSIIAGGSPQAQALILIHELGHMANVLKASDAGTGQGENNQAVWANCQQKSS